MDQAEPGTLAIMKALTNPVGHSRIGRKRPARRVTRGSVNPNHPCPSGRPEPHQYSMRWAAWKTWPGEFPGGSGSELGTPSQNARDWWQFGGSSSCWRSVRDALPRRPADLPMKCWLCSTRRGEPARGSPFSAAADRNADVPDITTTANLAPVTCPSNHFTPSMSARNAESSRTISFSSCTSFMPTSLLLLSRSRCKMSLASFRR